MLFVGCVAALSLCACEKVPEPSGGASPAVTKEPEAPEPADMIKEDVAVGTGAEAKDGDKVWVHYTGRLAKNGKEFDSSVGREPFDFEIGKEQVIKGWDQGVVGMKVGGKRKLTIPSKLGYGNAGSPPKIPPKATLVFDIELLSIGNAPGKAGEEKKDDKKEEKKDDKKADTKKVEPKKDDKK